MALWMSGLLPGIVRLIAPASLIIIGWIIERKFVGRISIFANTIAINIFAFYLPNPLIYFIWYCNIGLIFGIIALISRALEIRMPGLFYDFSWIYSSIAVGALMVIFTLF